ncbi:MAG TPA: beta-ketoacyl-[acyl-carrier-protein] synthase family protein, partial [Chthoniobacterales bacterium]|nr:beta-ketoacyl-[acyl-carrier-protein] synthase family protein [Chthoniobacterales bacterium]
FPELRSDEWSYPDSYKIPREYLRSMAPNTVYAYCAMKQAIADARLPDELVSNPRTGVLCASNGSGWLTYEYLDIMLEKGPMRCNPMAMVASIAGTLNMNLVACFGIKGHSLGFSTACASSAHALGEAFDRVQTNRQDIVFVAGAEDCNLFSILPFVCTRALTAATDPSLSPCAFDRKRDGFVVTGGAAVLVLEELQHAQKRGAPIYAEMLGWGEASDGFSVMAPEPQGDGLARAMESAIEESGIGANEVDYINAHGTSTPAGDAAEVHAIKRVFGDRETPYVSSTKSITGHGLSLAGAMEAGFCCLALRERFTPVSANITEIDPEFEGVRIVSEPIEHAPRIALTNSSGFGGTNVSAVLRRWDG